MLSFDLNRDEAVTTEEEIDGRRLDGETFEDRLQTKRGRRSGGVEPQEEGRARFLTEIFHGAAAENTRSNTAVTLLCTERQRD